MNPIASHPNATRAGGVSTLGILAVWVAGYFGLPLSAEEGAAVAGGASTVALFIGHDGIVGAWRKLLYGKR